MQLYNEDCLERMKKMPDKSVDLILTDPPYVIERGGHAGKQSYVAKNIKQRFDNELVAISHGIDEEMLSQMCRVMKKINIYLWCNKLQIHQYLDYFESKDTKFELIVWSKTNVLPLVNMTWLPDIEFCLYFREKGVFIGGNFHTKKHCKTLLCNKHKYKR